VLYIYGFTIVTAPNLHPVCAGLSGHYPFIAGLLALASHIVKPTVGLESLVTDWLGSRGHSQGGRSVTGAPERSSRQSLLFLLT